MKGTVSMRIPDCKKFTGYKPCEPYKVCSDDCDQFPVGTKILVVNLGAMGAVLMSTTLLPALKRKYPSSTIYWITEERNLPLLFHNPLLDFILPFTFRSILTLQEMEFDLVCNVDKIVEACALVNSLRSQKNLGFGLNKDGVIIPLNDGSEYNYRLGLDDELKFKKNTKTQVEMLRDMFELDAERDPYVLNLDKNEAAISENFLKKHGLASPVIGINTGSSSAFPNKRFTEEHVSKMIDTLYVLGNNQPVILLGGLEDIERNRKYAERFSGKVINTPADEGLRMGLAYVNICDIVVTGDSLGMHMAIGLGRHVVGWFNLTCSQEIDLFDRGDKIVSKAFCSPCWKKVCDVDLRCLSEPVSQKICEAVEKIIRNDF